MDRFRNRLGQKNTIEWITVTHREISHYRGGLPPDQQFGEAPRHCFFRYSLCSNREIGTTEPRLDRDFLDAGCAEQHIICRILDGIPRCLAIRVGSLSARSNR
jgi:hypothetical protein